MRELVKSWMNVIRPTHWNGQEIRCPLPIGDDSADSYQKAAAASFFRSRFVVLKIWYCSVSALSGFIITFLLLLLLIAVPIGSNLDFGVIFTVLTVFDAVVSVFAGVTALFAVLDRVFYRCHFPLEFGSPNHDATAIHLSSIIRVIRQRMVSEPKDRSYATHGVLRRLGMPLTPADYGKSLGQVYHTLGVSILSNFATVLNTWGEFLEKTCHKICEMQLTAILAESEKQVFQIFQIFQIFLPCRDTSTQRPRQAKVLLPIHYHYLIGAQKSPPHFPP